MLLFVLNLQMSKHTVQSTKNAIHYVLIAKSDLK